VRTAGRNAVGDFGHRIWLILMIFGAFFGFLAFFVENCSICAAGGQHEERLVLRSPERT